jgi:TetR/AcrR family transcriptional regulator, ethionamide resistance regulator
VLDATERLLAERPFSELSVNDIIDEAGTSRTSFYAHFDSRTSVIAECLRRVMGEIAVAVDPFLAESEADLDTAVRASIGRWITVASEHGTVLRTVSEQWPHDERLRELWFSIMARFVAGTARVIRAARGSGQAPSGANEERLSACLMWGYERVLQVATAGDAAGLPDADAIVEPLVQMMTGGVYGQCPPAHNADDRR